MENQFRSPTIQEIYFRKPVQCHLSRPGSLIHPTFEFGGPIANFAAEESSQKLDLCRSPFPEKTFFETVGCYISKNWAIMLVLAVGGVVIIREIKKRNEAAEAEKTKPASTKNMFMRAATPISLAAPTNRVSTSNRQLVIQKRRTVS